jgi:hypothetical protein
MEHASGSPPDAVSLAGQIEGLLAAYEAGHLPYEAMMQEFGRMGTGAAHRHVSLADRV